MGFDTKPKGEQTARDLENLIGAARLDVTKTKNLDQIDVFSLKNVGVLNKGGYRGDVPSVALSLAEASKGDWWKSSAARTLLGQSFNVGDELHCVSNQSGTPTTLTNFIYVENKNANMLGATGTVAGATGMVPAPAATDNNKALFGDATYKSVIQPTDVVNSLVSTATDRPLSAAQGKVLKDTIDAFPSNANPLNLSNTPDQGVSPRFSRQDHVHRLPFSVGDCKTGLQTGDHDGWVLLNGRAKSTLTASQQTAATSLGIGTTLPDPRGRYIGIAGSNGFTLNTVGGSATIARSALPNFTLTGDTSATNTAHTHSSGSLVTAVGTGNHEHTQTYPASTNFRYEGTGGSPNSANSVGSSTIIGTSGGGAHTHTVVGNTGSMSGNQEHNHSYTTQSINGNVTQTSHYPPYLALNMFIFLGA